MESGEDEEDTWVESEGELEEDASAAQMYGDLSAQSNSFKSSRWLYIESRWATIKLCLDLGVMSETVFQSPLI